jgi:hypothetical protein
MVLQNMQKNTDITWGTLQKIGFSESEVSLYILYSRA